MAEDIQAQTPVSGAEPTQTTDTVETLTASLKEANGRIVGLNRSVTRYQKELDAAKKASDERDLIVKGLEDSFAGLYDTVKASDGEEATAVKALAAKRAQQTVATVADPHVTAFNELLVEEGLKVDFDALDDPERTDPIVAEVLKDSTISPQAARVALKRAIKAANELEVQNRITLGVQTALKGTGATAQAVNQASGSGISLTRENLGRVNMENVGEYAKVADQFDEAIAKGTLK